MKKKLLMNVLVLVMAVAMIAAGTMAWFSDSDDAGEATFTAGILSIEAGNSAILSHYFDPSPEGAVYLYGAREKADGKSGLYEINMKTGEAHMFYEIDMNKIGGDTYSPNGIAFDKENKRLYFAIINGEKSTLWFYDFSKKELVQSSAKNDLPGRVYGASFWNNRFWYIKNDSDELYSISFHPDGTMKESNIIDDISNKNYNFGDIVFDIKDGILYGSTSNPKVFFTYNIADDLFSEITNPGNASNLQLAFGSDGVLYGHNTGDAKWYILNPGVDSIEANEIPGMSGIKFNDLASGFVSVWNPGNTDKMKYFAKNTGNKKIRLRAELDGSWNENGLSDDVVEYSVCSNPECPGSNWYYGNDGYFYYNGIIEPGESVELCVDIHLNGPNTGNDYQGKTFTLNCTMYAIQSTNGAPEASGWVVNLPD
jgi:predicted ribosomally synthesized peptide with SipW-like signal peptide